MAKFLFNDAARALMEKQTKHGKKEEEVLWMAGG